MTSAAAHDASTHGTGSSLARASEGAETVEGRDDARRVENLRDPAYRSAALEARLKIVRGDVSLSVDGLRGARRDIELMRLKQTLAEIDRDLALIARADA